MRSSDRSAGSEGQPIRVSFLCTANRARSPFAAALFREGTSGLPIVVDSYGTLDRDDAPALPQAIAAASAFGVDLAPHRAHSARAGAFEDADLVIGFEQIHVAHAVVTGGAERSRVFLLTELASACTLLDADPVRDRAEFRTAVAELDRVRAGFQSLPSAIGDPVGQSDRRFMETYESIERSVNVIGARLFGDTESEP